MNTPIDPANSFQSLAAQADAAHPQARVIAHLADHALPPEADINPAAMLSPHIANWELTPNVPSLFSTPEATVPVILHSLLHHGLTQNQTCVHESLANQLIAAFVNEFDETAQHFTNAKFGSDEYSDFFLSSWNPLIESPMDAGIVIASPKKIGLLWIAI